MNVLVVVSAPVVTFVPKVPLLPDHAPLAAQLVALVVDHVRALELPLVTLEGLALIEMLGVEAPAPTVTMTD